jgi:hypothetical protein
MITNLSDPVVIGPGKIYDVKLVGSAGSKELRIVDRNPEPAMMPVLEGAIDEVNFMPLDTSFMRLLADSETDMTLRINTMQFTEGFTYTIWDIQCTNDIEPLTPESFKEVDYHHFYDASMRNFCEEDLRKGVHDNIMELSKGALDNAGWPVEYYKAESLRNIEVLNAYELKAITEHKRVDVFFPHRKTIGNLDFDQFGLTYDELTNIHILADEFHRVYADKYARPNKLDIVYIKVLDQFFEISDVTDVKTPTNDILYYDCTMKFIADRSNVAKDTDVIDLSDLIDSTDQAEMFDEKDQNPAMTGAPSKFNDHTELDSDFGRREYAGFDEMKWSSQKFTRGQLRTLTRQDDNCYGIGWYLGGWQLIKIVQGIPQHKPVKSDNFFTAFSIPETGEDIYFAKFARFNNELSAFDEQLYYTTPKLSRTLQPLELIELQEQL